MHALLFNILLPLGVSILKQYIESSSSKKDDLILSTVKDGCSYLSAKDNNDMNIHTADNVAMHKMIGE